MAKNKTDTPVTEAPADAVAEAPAAEAAAEAVAEAPAAEAVAEAPAAEAVAEAPAAEAVAEAPAADAPQKVHIRAVYGTMIHPFKPMDIRHDTITEVDEIDSWLQSQIDAKKIVTV